MKLIPPSESSLFLGRLFMGLPVQMWNRKLLIFLFINLEVSMSIQAICTSKTCCTLVFFRFLYFEASNGLMVSYFIFLQITFSRKIYLGKAIRNSFPRTDCDSFLFCLKILSPNHPTFCFCLAWKLKVMRTSIIPFSTCCLCIRTCFNNLKEHSFALLFAKPFQWLQARVLYCWMVCQGLKFFSMVSTMIQASPEIMFYRLSYTVSCLVYHFLETSHRLPASHTIIRHSGHLVTGMQSKAVYQ